MKKIIFLLCCLSIGSANAALINISSVTASSTFHTYDQNNLINGSGLSGGLHSGDWKTKWLTNSTVTGSLIFDLGSVFDVSSSSIWNYGNGCCGADRSVKDLGIEASLDGILYHSIGDFVLNMPAGDPFAAEMLALNTTAQYIKFNINSNYGARFTGLSEVQFDGNTHQQPVPEPASLALLGLGLAGFGFSRKKKTA